MTIAMGRLWILSGVICTFASTSHFYKCLYIYIYMYICSMQSGNLAQSADCAATASMNYMHVCALER